MSACSGTVIGGSSSPALTLRHGHLIIPEKTKKIHFWVLDPWPDESSYICKLCFADWDKVGRKLMGNQDSASLDQRYRLKSGIRLENAGEGGGPLLEPGPAAQPGKCYNQGRNLAVNWMP